jgi:hypothetical protein
MTKHKPLGPHHSYVRSRGGSSHPDNITYLTDAEHEAMHGIAGCNALPHEIIFAVLSRNGRAFRQDFIRAIAPLLLLPHDEIYQPQVFNIQEESHSDSASLLSHG